MAQQPEISISGGTLKILNHTQQYFSDGHAYYATASGAKAHPLTSQTVKGAYDFLARGTSSHHVHHYTIEKFDSGMLDLHNLVRMIPIDVMSNIASAGALDAAISNNGNSLLRVVALMMKRHFVSFQADFGLQSMRAAILGAGPQLKSIKLDSTPIAQILRSELSSSRLVPLKYGTKIAAIESTSQLADLGSSDIFILYEAANQLFVENASMFGSASALPYPTFAQHRSHMASPLDVASLVSPIPAGVRTAILEDAVYATSTFSIKPKATTEVIKDNGFSDQDTSLDVPVSLSKVDIIYDTFEIE
jgi:hypothetical protein